MMSTKATLSNTRSCTMDAGTDLISSYAYAERLGLGHLEPEHRIVMAQSQSLP